MNNVDMGTVIQNTLFSFTFSGILTLLVLLGVCILWCTVPFAVFGVKKRLDGIEVAQRSQTEMLIGELKRINENLRQRVSGNAVQAAAVSSLDSQPGPQQISRAQTVRPRPMASTGAVWPTGTSDAEIQAALDEVEREMTRRGQPMPQRRPPSPTTVQPTQRPQPTQQPRPVARPAAQPAPVSAAATMFGPRQHR